MTEDLQAELDRLRDGVRAEYREIEQALGRALKYPAYADDPATFPGATEADGVCVFDGSAVTLAQQAAARIRTLEAETAAYRHHLLLITRDVVAQTQIENERATETYRLPWNTVYRRLLEMSIEVYDSLDRDDPRIKDLEAGQGDGPYESSGLKS